MALLTANVCLIWNGEVSTDTNEPLDVTAKKNFISSIIVTTQSGGIDTKKPALGVIPGREYHKFFGRGGSGIFFFKSDVNIDDVVCGHIGQDSGRLISTYVEQFYATGAEGGIFKMTTEFKAKKPVYKHISLNWFIWYDKDNSVWVLSKNEKSRDGTTFLENSSCLPQYGTYESDQYETYTLETQNWNCLEVTGAQAPVDESANAVYCQNGVYNSKPVFVTCDNHWYIFYSGTEWVLTDTPYNTKGIWISNSSTSVYDDFSNISGTNGHNDFNNQTLKITSLGVPAGSLRMEDGETIIFTENEVTSVTSE